MAEEATITCYLYWNPAGPGASAQTPHRTAEFPHNRNECLHKSHPQSGFSNYNFGDDAHLRFNITHSIYEHITSKSPTRARLRVFLRPPRDMQQGENAPELHAIIDISKRIDVHDWENIVRGRLVPALLTRGQPRRFVVARSHRTNSGCSNRFRCLYKHETHRNKYTTNHRLFQENRKVMLNCFVGFLGGLGTNGIFKA